MSTKKKKKRIYDVSIVLFNFFFHNLSPMGYLKSLNRLTVTLSQHQIICLVYTRINSLFPMKTAHLHDSDETRNKEKDIFIDPQPSLLLFSPSVFIKIIFISLGS